MSLDSREGGALHSICRVVPIEVVNRDNRDLRIGLRVIELAAETVELLDRLWRKNMSKIADVVGRLGQVFDLLGVEQRKARKKKPASKQAKNFRALKSFHRTPLYVGTWSLVPELVLDRPSLAVRSGRMIIVRISATRTSPAAIYIS